MTDDSDQVSRQIEAAKKQIELAELQARLPYSSSNPPIESPRKYGVFEEVKDEDAGEILGLLTGKPIATATATAIAIVAGTHPKDLTANRFASQGDDWFISYAGKTASVKHSLGLRYLQELIRNAGRAIPVTQLVALNSLAGEPLDREARELDSQTQDERTIYPTAGHDDSKDQLDAKGLRELEDKIRETITALTEAEKCNDPKALKLNEELEELRAWQRKCVGKHGKSRPFPQSQRPRTSVKKAIDRAIERIESKIPELANHLRDPRVLRTGSDCMYLDTEILWSLEAPKI